MTEPVGADRSRDLGEGPRRPNAPLDGAARQRGADRQDVRQADHGQRQEERGAEGPLGRARLAEHGRGRVPSRVIPHHDGEAHTEPRAEGPVLESERRPRYPARCRDPSDRESGDRQEHRDRHHDGGASRGSDPGEVQTREQDDEGERQEPTLRRRHARPPEFDVFHEQRRIDGNVHEAVEPAPPADLKRPVRPEGAARPRHVAAFVRHGRGELGHHERDGQAPEHRGQHQQEQRQSRAEGGNRVLDAVGPATHVEEDDRRQRQDAQLALEPCRQLTSPGRRR